MSNSVTITEFYFLGKLVLDEQVILCGLITIFSAGKEFFALFRVKVWTPVIYLYYPYNQAPLVSVQTLILTGSPIPGAYTGGGRRLQLPSPPPAPHLNLKESAVGKYHHFDKTPLPNPEGNFKNLLDENKGKDKNMDILKVEGME